MTLHKLLLFGKLFLAKQEFLTTSSNGVSFLLLGKTQAWPHFQFPINIILLTLHVAFLML